MANIHETISEIEKLSPELAKQVKKFVKDHSYGLVYEQNLPDSVRLWTKKPVKYDKVNIIPSRGQFDTEENHKVWYVSDIVDNTATLIDGKETKIVSADDIIPVVDHTDVIYPGLKVLDKIERGSKDDPYHMVINAENYHALEALVYSYAGKVDCIYIDPPYNTGAKDWKYDNNYVGSDDQYRHSKWLAMMERRLNLAKKLLNPKDSVLIVSIDEKEYLRLGMLLEQMFPEARIQMISSRINATGIIRSSEFIRVDEYIFFVMFGNVCPYIKSSLGTNSKTVSWHGLRRRDAESKRGTKKGGIAQFYPIYVNDKSCKIQKIGNALPFGIDRNTVETIEGCTAVFPLKPDGTEMNWGLIGSVLEDRLSKGYVRVKRGKSKVTPYSIEYLTSGYVQDIEDGKAVVVGHNEDGSVIAEYPSEVGVVKNQLPTQWNYNSHYSKEFGTGLLRILFNDKRFSYPKSLYAVEDCIRLFVSDKPNALIVDFFAGSGTTSHAVMLLNRLDGGHRRSIMVTNNEIGPDAEKDFTKNKKLRPSDDDWQKYGIAKYITWPRIKSAITGIDVTGQPIKGDYKFTQEFPMSEGFKENAIFCELTYETLWDIRLDRAFNAVAPILWALAGCKGPIIEKLGKGYATTCNYAVLFKYDAVNKLVEAIKKKPSIEHVFVVTDDQQRYLSVISKLPMIKPQNIHRLYESYLRSFEIVGEGGLD